MKSNYYLPERVQVKNNVSNISTRHNCPMSLLSYGYYNNYNLWYTHKTIQSTFFPQTHTPSDQIYTLEDITQRS